MSIQGTINQTLSVASLLLSKRAPTAKLGKLAASISGDSPTALKESANVAKKQWEQKPTKESFNRYVSAERNLAESKANERLSDEQTRIKKTRRNFGKYLESMGTSLGVQVGALSKEAQKEIAKQYSKSQRKKLMDEMDKR